MDSTCPASLGLYSASLTAQSPQVGDGMADPRKELSRRPWLCRYGILWEEHRFAARCDTPQLHRSQISPKWEKPRESEVTVKLGDVSPWRDVWLTAFLQHFHPGCSWADVCLLVPPASAPAQPHLHNLHGDREEPCYGGTWLCL